MAKSPEVHALNYRKKWTKTKMRKTFGLPAGYPIQDAVAFIWCNRLKEAIKLKIIKRDEANKGLKWLDEFNQKIMRMAK